jgi:phosphoenolpyruvate carboxylase
MESLRNEFISLFWFSHDSIPTEASTVVACCEPEFWKHIPLSEPFRLLLGDMRDKLHNSRERMRQLLATGKCDIPVEDTYTDAAQVINIQFSASTLIFFLQFFLIIFFSWCWMVQILEPLELCHRSLCAMGDKPITDGSLLDFMRQVLSFGLGLVKLDIQQESDRHTDAIDYSN